MIAAFSGLQYVGVPLGPEDFSLDEAALIAAIQEHEPALLFLAYPNNPTGNLFDAAVIERVIRATPGLVIIDEAYAPFTDASFMSRIGEFENMVVMRTVSKLGLAGLRLGLLCGHPSIISEIDKIRLPYNINVLTQASAEFALRHKAVFDRQTAQIRAERPRLAAAIAAHDGVTVYPSEANFLLVRTPPGRGRAWFDGLRQRGVLIERKWQVDGYTWAGDHWDVSVTKMVEKGGNLVPSDEQVVIHAEHVVTATGNHAQRTAQMLGIKMPAIPVEHQYIVTEPDPATFVSAQVHHDAGAGIGDHLLYRLLRGLGDGGGADDLFLLHLGFLELLAERFEQRVGEGVAHDRRHHLRDLGRQLGGLQADTVPRCQGRDERREEQLEGIVPGPQNQHDTLRLRVDSRACRAQSPGS